MPRDSFTRFGSLLQLVLNLPFSRVFTSVGGSFQIAGLPPAGSVGVAYSYAPTIIGGSGSYTYALTGSLPAGLTFSTTTGTISGTPTAAGTLSGISVSVIDTGTAKTAALTGVSITVNASAPTLAALTVSVASATVGSAYSGTVSGQTNGSTLSLSGAGAAGLTISGTTISGTPTTTGPVNVVETLSGATNTPRTTSGLITVAAAPATLSALSVSSSAATVGSAFTATITGKTTGSTITLSGPGAPGLTVSGTSISGTPSAVGVVNLIETLAGATNSPRTTSSLITVSAAPVTLSALTLAASTATVGTAYVGTVSGKTSGSTLSLTGAGAPGLVISGASISGTPTTAGTVNVVETLAGATNSPRTSSGLITVAAAPVTLSALAVSSTSATVGTAYSGTISGNTSGSSLALSGAGAAGLTLSGTTIAGTPTTAGSVDLVETLAGATNSPRTTSGAVTVAAVAANYATLSPTDKTSGLTLSTDNLTATSTAANGTGTGVRATQALTAKTYMEFRQAAGGSVNDSIAVGVVDPSYNLATGAGNQLFYWNADGVYDASTQFTPAMGWTVASVVRVAVDPTAKLIWFAVDAGTWNNSGSANPATGTGGLSLSAFASIVPCIGLYTNGYAETVNFGASTFAYAPPSGFSGFVASTGTPTPTLAALTLSPSTATVGTAYNGTVSNVTTGSTVTLSGAGAAGLSITGSGTTRSLSGTPTSAGTVNVVETLAGATGSPRTTSGLLTVSAAGTAPVLPLPFFVSANYPGGDNYGGTDDAGVVGTNYFMPEASTGNFPFLSARINGPLRLPIRWEAIQPTIGGPLSTNYTNALTSGLDALATAGLTCIIDLHNYMHRTVVSTDRYVDGSDGVLTRAHLVDFWQKLVTQYKNHPAVAGYDIMNEPQGGHGPLGVIMQAVVNAIAAIDSTKPIYVEGANFSSAKEWVDRNSSYYPLTEPVAGKRLIVYSGHCYPDYDHSGTHFAYADSEFPPPNKDALTATTLVDISTSFVNWGASNGVQVHIGETNVGIDDARWNTVLLNGLTFWKNNNVPVHIWLYGPRSSSDAYNLYPNGGVVAPQWAPIQQVTGKGPTTLSFYGPNNGTAGSASLPFQVRYQGYSANPITVTPSDGGQGGTFSPTSVTIPAGSNTATQTFTYTQSASKAVTISLSASGYTATPVAYTTNAAAPISGLSSSDQSFSTGWSTSNAGLTANFTTADDGTTPAARFTDNGSAQPHYINNYTSISVLPGQPSEYEFRVKMESVPGVRLTIQGGTSAASIDFDIANGRAAAASVSSGATVNAVAMTVLTNGWYRVRASVTLASADTVAYPYLYLASPVGTTAYLGGGAPIYVAAFNSYVGPIHTITGPPLVNSAPSISGTATTGSVLTASTGTYINGATSYAYQWRRDGTAISGATSNTYTLVSADEGHVITCAVTATNASGAGQPAPSSSVTPVSASAFKPTDLTVTKRWFTASDATTITVQNGRAITIMDKAGSGKPFTDGGNPAGTGAGPAVVSSSTFGATKAAFRAVNGDTQGSGTPGAYGRMIGDMSDLAAASQWSIMATMSLNSCQSYGRMLSFASSANDDFVVQGAFCVLTQDTGRQFTGLENNVSAPFYDPGAFDTPVLIELVCDGTNIQMYVNGAVNGSPFGGASNLVSAAKLAVFANAYSGGGLTYGDLRSLVFTTGALTTTNRQKLEGWFSWDAKGDGSLLPTGHPYKSAAP